MLLLCLDHSLTLVGLRCRLYEQQTLRNCSVFPRSRRPQTTRMKAQRPEKHCKTKSGETRKVAERRTDVKPRQETHHLQQIQDSQTPLQLLVEAVTCSFLPHAAPHVSAEQHLGSGGRQVPARIHRPCRQSAGVQKLRSL